VRCAILAAAGPQRSRMLATLYKDERCARLALFPFLEKVYLERILQAAEVRARRSRVSLQPFMGSWFCPCGWWLHGTRAAGGTIA
jgi:hypothetical protein